MDPSSALSGISSLFNFASAGGFAAIATIGAAFLFGRPKMIKPNSGTAKIVTGYKFPSVRSSQFVVRNRPQAVWKFGLTDPEDVSLKSFTVKVARKGIHLPKDEKGNILEHLRESMQDQKDESLTLKDKIKAEVDVDFYVQVDTEDSPAETDAEGKVIRPAMTSDQKIILAKRTLGEINEKTIEAYLAAKADSALRAAAAQMTIDEIQSDREAFLKNVLKNISLAEHGLKVTDAALKDFRQAPKESFNPNDYFDAQGLQLVTEKANASLKAVNESNQHTETAIALKTQEQTVARLKITQDQEQARLAQSQQIAQMTAEQERQVKTIQAEQKKQGDIATIENEQQTEQRRIAKDQQIGISNAEKDQQIKVATEKSNQASQTAAIVREQAVEIANRAKEIALQAQAALVAEAQQAANLKRADAVRAEQEVVTAKETAEAERNKKVAVIRAEQTALEDAAGKKIDADVQVYVAEKGLEAKRKEGEGLTVLAAAQADAAKTRAEGAYAEQYQPLKAVADGKLADAAAEEKLNEARNKLSDAARQFQVDMKRVEVTPEIVQSFVAAMASIDNFNVTSISGAPGSNVAAGGGAPGADGSNVFEQFYAAARNNMLQQPLLKRLLTDMGGDPKIADSLPGMNAPAPVVTDKGVAAPAPSV